MVKYDVLAKMSSAWQPTVTEIRMANWRGHNACIHPNDHYNAEMVYKSVNENNKTTLLSIFSCCQLFLQDCLANSNGHNMGCVVHLF